MLEIAAEQEFVPWGCMSETVCEVVCHFLPYLHCFAQAKVFHAASFEYCFRTQQQKADHYESDEQCCNPT